MGQSPPGTTYNEYGEGTPFYQGVVDFGSCYPSRRVYCTAPTRVAEPGDILFSVRAPIGRVNIATERCSIGRGLAVIQPHDPNDRVFVEFVLRAGTSHLWDMFEGGGSVFGNARKDDLCGKDGEITMDHYTHKLTPTQLSIKYGCTEEQALHSVELCMGYITGEKRKDISYDEWVRRQN